MALKFDSYKQIPPPIPTEKAPGKKTTQKELLPPPIPEQQIEDYYKLPDLTKKDLDRLVLTEENLIDDLDWLKTLAENNTPDADNSKVHEEVNKNLQQYLGLLKKYSPGFIRRKSRPAKKALID